MDSKNQIQKREIKFRAWDESQKYMAYQGTVDLETIQSFIYHFGDNILMQFIGLTDNQGVELYDGDIVKDRFARIMRIGIWNYRFCFISISETNFHHADFFDWIERDNRLDDENFPIVEMNVEKIGNIHENPELIK